MGADVLDQQAMRMPRFIAPVTMLATGGAGQVGSLAALYLAGLYSGDHEGRAHALRCQGYLVCVHELCFSYAMG